MGKRILIVDDEPDILRMIESVLRRSGHEVIKAANGLEGLEKALRLKPDLVITDVLMPEGDGWSFIRSLRSHKDGALIPVIFLTALSSAKDRVLGFRLGADDYLPKPFHLEELELRVERVLRHSQKLHQDVKTMNVRTNENIGLQGNLSQVGFSSVLLILEMEKKSGLLVLHSQIVGRMFLKNGRALDAFFDGQARPRGAEAIYTMLTWTRGTFEFSYLDVEMEDKIQIPINQLLLEGARRMEQIPFPDV
jgi:CheY-like chemotaxis protein